MSEITKHLNFYNQMAARTLLRWNRNYFVWLEKYLGEPTEFGDRLKIAWQKNDRKIVYHASLMTIQVFENPDGTDLKWNLVKTKQYPTEEQIKNYGEWLAKTGDNG